LHNVISSECSRYCDDIYHKALTRGQRDGATQL
jgi:hypothetical protein